MLRPTHPSATDLEIAWVVEGWGIGAIVDALIGLRLLAGTVDHLDEAHDVTHLIIDLPLIALDVDEGDELAPRRMDDLGLSDLDGLLAGGQRFG